MHIGDLKLENNVILAPMAGVSDLPFRILCKEKNCGLLYTEMVSAKAISFGNKNTEMLLRTSEVERPVAVQLFGSDPSLLAEVAAMIEDRGFDIIDINMGCPVPKIVNNKEGSALMKNPKLIGEIVRKVSSAVKLPLTVKIRKGFDDAIINAVEVAKIAEENGAAAVGVHGRTREQYYSGKADWDIIKKVKQSVSIPVLGNGDVTGPIEAKKMLEETGCDGIMIGRAARGNPWIFEQVDHYLRTGELLPEPTTKDIIQMIKRHSKMLVEFKGEYVAIREMRKHVSWYTKGMHHATKIRKEINYIESLRELEEKLELLLELS